jgi:hypothetical protein
MSFSKRVSCVNWALAVAAAAFCTGNRVVTRYNRDADVILAGIGYRF